ncbi:ROK family protein [Actinopolymorpha sp. B11F2]|uniref:ROK family protein n=1 Tax=Actinopolymorpha sp. B11F2 TaxID=3160862 RepID=UPI0032E37515
MSRTTSAADPAANTGAAPQLLVGVDVGGTKIAGGVVDPRTGTVRHRVTVPTDLRRGSDAVLLTTVALVRQLADAVADEECPLGGVGVGVPELVSPAGDITSDHLLAWRRDELAAAVAADGGPAARDDLPVRIESDVRAAALAEARFGAGREHEVFVYVTIGTGISFSLVQHGVPYAGARGNALLLLAPGAKPTGPDVVGRPGAADQPPLLETVAAGPALVERFRVAGGQVAGGQVVGSQVAGGRVEGDARMVLDAAAAGDPVAVTVVRDAGDALGDAIALLVNALDPEAVVVGGGLGLAGGAYLAGAVDRARRMIWAPQTRALPIVPAGLGVHAGVVGAALAADADHGR